MALTSTIHTFEIELSDVDRSVFEHLSLRVACHPSESPEHFVTRVLAYCLEFTPGIEFGRGLSDPDEPALAVRDLTGALRVWIDVGSPDARRLHRASKAAPRVVVYTHKDPALVLRALEGERIHRAEHMMLRSFNRTLIAGLVARLERRTAFSLSVTDDHLYVTVGADTFDGPVGRHALPGDET